MHKSHLCPEFHYKRYCKPPVCNVYLLGLEAWYPHFQVGFARRRQPSVWKVYVSHNQLCNMFAAKVVHIRPTSPSSNKLKCTSFILRYYNSSFSKYEFRFYKPTFQTLENFNLDSYKPYFWSNDNLFQFCVLQFSLKIIIFDFI